MKTHAIFLTALLSINIIIPGSYWVILGQWYVNYPIIGWFMMDRLGPVMMAASDGHDQLIVLHFAIFLIFYRPSKKNYLKYKLI